MIQKIFILDTNVYGEILIEPNREELVHKIERNKIILVYGLDVIEKELNETPSHVKYRGETTRNLLFTLFESLADVIINVPPLAKYLAEEYFKKYGELTRKHKISKKYNKKVYDLINKMNGLRTPELLEYKKFKEVYLQ